MVQVSRVQTGVRVESRLLKVLKALAEYLDISLGDLFEGIVLHQFEGKPAFSQDTLSVIEQLRGVYGLELTARDSHRLTELASGPRDGHRLTVLAAESRDSSRRRVRLEGAFPVAVAPDEALRLFTPSGERLWAPGWDPEFPAATGDETEPGTVFLTSHHGRNVTWVVVACEPGRSVSYANMSENIRASLVHVVCEAAADGTSIAHVTYHVTALSAGADEELATFAAGYGSFLESWRTAIDAALAREDRAP